jgi:hypothetical protein
MLLSCFAACGTKTNAPEAEGSSNESTGTATEASGTNTEPEATTGTTEPEPEPEPLPDINPDPDVKLDIVPGISAELKANVDKAVAKFDTDVSNDPADFSVDVWDGVAEDIAWFTKEDVAAAKKYTIATAAELIGFRTLINENTFEGWEISLGKNIDLANKPLAGITGSFEGTFDGKGFVISNLSLLLAAKETGFFAKAGGNATFVNFGFVNGTFTIEDGANRTQLGTICGIANTAEGKIVSFSNIYSNVDILRAEITKGSNNKIGGILGEATGAGNVMIENCVYDGDINLFPVNAKAYDYNQGAMVGGIVGYFNKPNKATLQGCIFNGTLDGARMSGGLLGAVIQNSKENFAINACIVNGKLNMNIQEGNPYAGGLAGRVSAKTFTLNNSSFNGEMTVVLGSTTPKQAAGGLVGVIFDGGESQPPAAIAILTDCQVNGRVSVVVDAARKYKFGIYYGATEADGATVATRNLTTGTDYVFGLLGKSALKDAKYNMNFVAAIDALPEGSVVGFDYFVYVLDEAAGKVAKAENVRVFAELAAEVTFSDGTVYKAADFEKAFLYSLEIKDIEAKYSLTDKSIEVVVTPFIATKAGDVVTVTDSYTVHYGVVEIPAPVA